MPPSRWVVNFDFDLLDGLVIGALLGAHLPFLINTHLIEMYTQPATAEQCLHNALKVVSALRHIGIDYDVQVRFIHEMYMQPATDKSASITTSR